MAHKHSVYDTDPHFSIDAATRVITNLSTNKTKIIQYDHNSERFTFEIPRFIDGHDMSLCDTVEIHYINVATNKNQSNADVYLCEDVQLSPNDENIVIFSWLLSRNATQYAGTLNFLIRFICLDGEEIAYVWNTAIFKDITISDGMNNTELIVEEYSDLLNTWRDNTIKSIEQTVTSEEDGGTNVLTITQADGTKTTFEVKNGSTGNLEDEGLVEEVKQIINETVDFSDYQEKTDETLKTTDKTVVGAINEVKNKIEEIPIKLISISEPNEITKAVEVTTTDSLLASEANAILYGYKVGYGGKFEVSTSNAFIKLFVKSGDVIRQKLSPYWVASTYHIASYKADGTFISMAMSSGTVDGYTVPENVGFVIVNIANIYNKSNGVCQNGFTAEVITINGDISLTEYDNTNQADDYVSEVVEEEFYSATEDLRIERYEKALGDIETILAEVVGGV